MRELPILFSTDMVQALLAGRKTQTRREIKSRNAEMTALLVNLNAGIRVDESKAELIRCFSPYGVAGDWLWVREAFMAFIDPDGIEKRVVYYRANFAEAEAGGMKTKWKPSIHLKKEESRIWLQNIELCIERLMDISEKDAYAEGVETWNSLGFNGDEYRNYLLKGDAGKQWPNVEICARNSFSTLWQHINGEESTNSNPWVWVVKFKALSTTGKPVEAVA